MRYPVAKRIFDMVLAGTMLAVLSPAFAFVFALIAVDMLFVPADRGPWLYRERRITAGREFDVLKFRVLRLDAIRAIKDGSYARLSERDLANLTWAGARIKVAYLDELPQIVNVLRGEMSLVGPRPWPLPMVEKQRADGHTYRDEVVAGWTGPAQVQKDQPRTSYNALDLDLAYVDALQTWPGRRLVWFDIQTLWHSVKTMGRRRGLTY